MTSINEWYTIDSYRYCSTATYILQGKIYNLLYMQYETVLVFKFSPPFNKKTTPVVRGPTTDQEP